mgnify:CR=1 FL=1|tara:strand:- start:314 stop:1324 length:1011 start_codon:yes stop_codon:yes gene_type:complete
MASNNLEMFKRMLSKQFKDAIIFIDKNDINIKSNVREDSKKDVEKFLDKKNVNFTNIFKKNKSGSINVLTVPDFKTDIIFKPIIAKGQGGRSFESEIEKDLNNYFAGADMKDIKNSNVINELQKKLDLNQSNVYHAIREGNKNQKRIIAFSGTSLDISKSDGKTLTDVTIQKNGKDLYFLSLKMSQSYYILNAAVEKYFLNKNTQIDINEFFGFDGLKMAGFGEGYACDTQSPNYATIAKNLADVLEQAVGTNVVFVHKKTDNDVLVKNIGSNNQVTINSLNESSYSYPELGKRKGGSIKVTANINGSKYKIDFQFRGTVATDTGAKYLRILLERL